MKIHLVRTMPDGECIELDMEDATAVDVVAVVESIFGAAAEDVFSEIPTELLH